MPSPLSDGVCPWSSCRSTDGRGKQLAHTFPLVDLLPYGRQESWQDSPDGWPQRETFDGWLSSQDVARLYGPASAHID